MKKHRIFISHASEDWEIADALGEVIHKAFAGAIEYWFSSDRKPAGGIPPGKRWEANIHEHLRESMVVFSLITPRSKDRIWLYWEAGIASENCPGGVVPVTLGVAFRDLPQPLTAFQGVNGLDCDSLCSALLKIGNSASLDAPADYLRTISRKFVRKITPLIERADVGKKSVLEDRELVTREEFSKVVSRFERKLDSLVGRIDVPQVLNESEPVQATGSGLENAAREALSLVKAGARLDLGIVRALAASLFNAGDIEQAAELQSYIAASGNPTAYDFWNLGMLLQECNRIEEAEQAYRKTTEIDSTVVDAWVSLGIILDKQGRPEEAEQAYENALSVDPDNALAWYNMGLLLAHCGRADGAEKAYKNALKSNPEDSFAWNNLGKLLRESGRMKEAERAFRKATKHNPDNAPAWNNLGNVMRDTGRLEGAERAYRRAIKADPRYVLAWYNLATLLVQNDRLDEARDACKKAVEADPDDANSHELLAILLKEGRIR